MKKTIFTMLLFCAFFAQIAAQDIPQHISYTRIYDFLDELATDGVIEINSAVKPYSRQFIADKLAEAHNKQRDLSRRQFIDLKAFMQEYSLEYDKLPDRYWNIYQAETWKATYIQPAFYYRDSIFRARITPLLGMHIWKNDAGTVTKRWFGAELQTMLGKHWSIYGSLRDISMSDKIAMPLYLNDFQGMEYKEHSNGVGGDFSDSRGGIKYTNRWFSIGLIKDNIAWGDNYHGSNIISGRAPSFPMITLRVKPVKWFELNYIHGWLVSNVKDSTNYYLDNEDNKNYRMQNKFIAANFFTFTPIKKMNISFGNSIIYAEKNVQPAYFIPVTFYKSIDHSLTKGAALVNQNSQIFFNISSRNIKHLHLFASLFADEINFARFKPSNKQENPISYKVGANLSNFPLKNLSFVGEFTRSNILNYKHCIPALTWASNDYNLGHYLGDNSQEIYAAVHYKPISRLDITLSYTDAKHGNDYAYMRSNDLQIISQPVLNDIIWQNTIIGLKAVYEIFSNAYAMASFEMSDMQTHEPSSPAINGELRLTQQQYADYFAPAFLQGKKRTIMVGFGFGF